MVQKSEEARAAQNAYMREWRKKNPEKAQAARVRYWEKKAREQLNQLKPCKTV